MNITLNTAVQTLEAPEVAILQETGRRRALQAELAEITAQLRSFQERPDVLSQEVRRWHRGLLAALRVNQEIEPIFDRYISLLQKILVDTITGAPLGTEALLGSDGHCYGHHPLCLFMHGLPENLRQRSPLDLDNSDQDSFVTKPHPTARFLVGWLERYGARLQALEIDRSFVNLTNQLGERNVRFLVPNARNHRLRRIQEIARQRREQEEVNRRFEEQILEAERRQMTEVQRVFSALSTRAEQAANQTLAQMDGVEQRSAQQMRQLDREIERAEVRVTILQQEISELEEQISRVEGELGHAERETLEVEKEVKEIEAAIEERKKERAHSLQRALVVAAGCIAVTILLPGSVALLPVEDGAALSLPIHL